MGVLLILFPEEENSTSVLNKNKFSQQSTSFIKRTTNPTQLLSKAQFTIFICALLILLSALLFTLSTFEPHPSSLASYILPRRHLSLVSAKSHFKYSKKSPNYSLVLPHALQGMGIMYRRGTKAMSDLIVAHVLESLNVNDLKLFLRVLQRSALISRSDLVFIFPSKSRNSNFDAAILEESDSFLKLIEHLDEMVLKRSNFLNSTASFDATQLMKWSKMEKESSKPIWGRRITSRFNEGDETESTRLSYGSVVGFTVDELDLGNSLSGFLDHFVPMSLRRWACYPMLLGRVKRNYKHIMLVDAKEILLPGDPMGRLRNMSPESIGLYPVSTQFHSTSTKHGKKKGEKSGSNWVTPAIIMGGGRGVRRLANAMLNDIVRMSMQPSKKRRNSLTEFGVFNQLVNNEYLLKNVKLIHPISELISLSELKSEPGSELSSIANISMIRRANSNFVVDSTLMRNIMCAWNLDSLFYRDCQVGKIDI